MAALKGLSSTSEGARLTGSTLASISSVPGGRATMARLIAGGSRREAGREELLSLLSNIAGAGPPGAARAAQVLAQAATQPEGAKALVSMMAYLSSPGRDGEVLGVTRFFADAAFSPEGRRDCARILQCAGKGEGVLAGFLEHAAKGEGGRSMGKALALISSEKEGAITLARLLAEESSRSPVSGGLLLKSFASMSSSPEGARYTGHLLANLSLVPEGGKALTRLVQASSRTAEGRRGLMETLDQISSVPGGAYQGALVLKRASSTAEGAAALGASMGQFLESPEGTGKLLPLLSRMAQDEEAAPYCARALLQVASGRENDGVLKDFFRRASQAPRESRVLAQFMERLSSTESGAVDLSLRRPGGEKGAFRYAFALCIPWQGRQFHLLALCGSPVR